MSPILPGDSEDAKNDLGSSIERQRLIKKYGLPIGILAVAGLIALSLIATAPKSKRKPRERNALLVEVAEVNFTSERVQIPAMGLVQPAVTVELRPRVSGEIISVNKNFLPGGIIQENETVLNLDPTDYRLAVRQIRSSVAEAEANYKLEQGNQSIARREYEVLGEEIDEEDRELVLRQPQLQAARAAYDAALANLEKAKLNLGRTAITAPFNAVIVSREVNVGSTVSETTVLGQLAGTDHYWVVASVPVDELKWLQVSADNPEQASSVRIYDEGAWGADKFRTGYVLRISAILEEEGRMARVLIAVPDPLAISPANAEMPGLLLNSYVRVVIEGTNLESVAVIDRSVIRDGDKVWIMDKENKLSIRKVEIVFSGSDNVFVRSGVVEGERVVSSYLTAPVEGMLLRVDNEGDSTTRQLNTVNPELKE